MGGRYCNRSTCASISALRSLAITLRPRCNNQHCRPVGVRILDLFSIRSSTGVVRSSLHLEKMDGKRNEGVNSYKHPDGSLNRCVCPQQLRNMQLQGGSVCIGDVGPFLIGGDTLLFPPTHILWMRRISHAFSRPL